MSERVLIIAAHPDDEVLGAGGVIARHADAGNPVDIVFLADGVTARPGVGGLERRHDAARRAAQILKANEPVFFDFPDNRLDTVSLLDVVQAVEQVVAKSAPDIVYTHHGGDLNVDHRVVHQAVLTAMRPLPGTKYRQIFAFEVSSSTEWAAGDAFRPNHFVNVAATLERKIAALEAYAEEMRPFPHARSLEAVRALAAWRGAAAGLHAAEAFVTLRSIQR